MLEKDIENLIANIIPKIRKDPLENIGISCVEVDTKKLQDLAEKYSYTFIENRPDYPGIKNQKLKMWKQLTKATKKFLFGYFRQTQRSGK